VESRVIKVGLKVLTSDLRNKRARSGKLKAKVDGGRRSTVLHPGRNVLYIHS
jgi:hypothetical protein